VAHVLNLLRERWEGVFPNRAPPALTHFAFGTELRYHS
jgi:hypothetical protein